MHAQGGPPFITDDFGTPGNRHWEINPGWIGDHNPRQAYYQLPDINMNYGWGDRIQLKYELPLAAASDRNNTTRAGHLRLLFMGGRGIQAVTRQNSEPNWIAYLGVQILPGPKDEDKPAEK
ncbi:MAG: hypothetical protein ABSG62_11275 [Terracidiphilus sp.]|jgi:hypothetical protein